MHLLSADGLAAAALLGAVRSFSERHAMADRAVLDVGCGTMPYRPLFTGRGARYIGADIDGSPDVRIAAEGTLPFPDSSINYVLSLQVLEHVRNVPAYLETIRRVLQADGHMLLTTHGVWPYHPHPTDYWRWTREGLRATLEDAGFRVVSISALCGPAAWIPMFPLLAFKKLLGPISPVLAPLNLSINLLAGAADRVTPAALRDTNAAIYAVELARTS